jgi:hypothetical protein
MELSGSRKALIVFANWHVGCSAVVTVGKEIRFFGKRKNAMNTQEKASVYSGIVICGALAITAYRPIARIFRLNPTLPRPAAQHDQYSLSNWLIPFADTYQTAANGVLSDKAMRRTLGAPTTSGRRMTQ